MDVGNCSVSSLPELHTRTHKTLVPSDSSAIGMVYFISLTFSGVVRCLISKSCYMFCDPGQVSEGL